MALPQSRASLKDWCLRKLGQGAIKINVTSAQVEDRIDEAIERFQQYHFEGTERVYFKRQISASTLKFASAIGFSFILKEEITGLTSGAKALAYDQAADNLSIRFITVSGSFIPGETISGTSGTAVLSSAADAITLGDKDNGYIPCDDSVLSIIDVIAMPGFFGNGLFGASYQLAIQTIPLWVGGGAGNLGYYYEQRQYLHLIEELFIGEKPFDFNRLQNRLYIHLNWKEIEVDSYLIIQCYKAINPETYKKLYSEYFVREYATSLIKKQWGSNLTKYNKIVMPGGVTLNGDQLYKQAETELETLEKDLRDKYQCPPIFFVG